MVIRRSSPPARPWQPWMLYQSRRRILKLALVSRLLILVGMMVSDRLIPDHNPGDDVLQFDLRLDSNCFCQEGLACINDTDGFVGSCYASDSPSLFRFTVESMYKLMLPPLTKWDAARFLSLAANPEKRQPRKNSSREKACQESDTPQEVCDAMRFIQSEQSHAFFPLFPTLVRMVTRRILHWIPWILLPPTYEGVLVLVAWWINTIAFIFAALALHELTYTVTKKSIVARELCVQCAYTSAFIFCFNPASIFYSTCYSESLFSMFTFSGYFFAEQHHYFAAMTCWMAACYTRSNGTMVILWLTLEAIGRCFRNFHLFLLDEMFSLFWETTFLLLPVLYHDWNGYYLHCIHSHHTLRPTWCKQAFRIPGVYQYFHLIDIWDMKWFKTFALYKYVQREHWNVGFLRYYEWKQLPNFLLAFPVLFLGTCAVVTWIRQSWSLFIKNEKTAKEESVDKWYCKLFCWPFEWAAFSFRASAESPETTISNLEERQQPKVVLIGPTLLAYYTVLGAACLVGATIAHVQISTRFIFSSCPAIYWYIAYLCLRNNENADKSRNFFARLLLSRNAIVCYCAGFILAGIIMHVNWLPWT